MPSLYHRNEQSSTNPQDAFAHYHKGLALHNLGRHEEALAAYEQSLRLNPQWADAHLNKGLALLELGRIETGLAAFERSLRLNPQQADAHLNTAGAQQRLGRIEEALAAFERSLQLDPQNVAAHLNKGLALLGLGRFEEALAAIEQSLQLDPQQAVAYRHKGVVLVNLKRYEEALAAYEQCLRLDPQDALAHFFKSLALAYLGRYEEAFAYGQGFQMNPQQAAALSSIGGALYDLGRHNAYGQGSQIDPQRAAVLSSIGGALYDLGRYKEFVQAADSAGGNIPVYPAREPSMIIPPLIGVLFLVGLLFYFWVPLDRPSSFSFVQAVISRVLEAFYIHSGLSIVILVFLLILGKDEEIAEVMNLRTMVRVLTRVIFGALCFVVQIVWFRPGFTFWGEIKLAAIFVIWYLLLGYANKQQTRKGAY
jgi:tetratricopeptide (TPR) repeat protein